MKEAAIPCPFTYSNGRCCTGTVYRARPYGPRSRHGGDFPERDAVRKYRLWCSKHDDHAGAVPSTAGKMRMEFYPDHLPAGVEDALWERGLLG